MEIQNNCCPNCGKLLELKQINFETAVFICLDTKCPYPVYGECIVVKRNIKNVNKQVDLHKQFTKQKMTQHNYSNSINDTSTESDFMLELDNLLQSQEKMQTIEGTSNLCQSSQSNTQTEISQENGPSLELSELDDFLAELLR